MAANTIPTVSTLPPAPTRADAPADFTTKADAFVAALPPLVTEVNLTVKGMNDQASYLDQLKTDTIKATSDNATAAANSAKSSSDSAAASATSANQAAEFRDSAQTAAAAAQSSAGLPSISGKTDFMLSVNANGNGVEWRASVPRPTSATAGYAVVVNPAGNGFVSQAIPISPITRYMESTPQAFAAGGTINFPHNLGVVPKVVSAYLICKAVLNGYAVGDKVEWPISTNYNTNSNGQNSGGSALFDASNVSIKLGTANACMVLDRGGSLQQAANFFNIVVRVLA